MKLGNTNGPKEKLPCRLDMSAMTRILPTNSSVSIMVAFSQLLVFSVELFLSVRIHTDIRFYVSSTYYNGLDPSNPFKPVRFHIIAIP